MRMRRWSVLMILILGFAISAPAQQPDERAMMEAWEKAGTPGDPHKKLEAFVGSWDVKVKSWMAPGGPAMESTGTSENRWILGGRYLEQRFQGSFMDSPFTGIGYTGYDNVKKQYVGTWMDSMSTGVMLSAGVADPSGKIMMFAANMADPMTGRDAKIEMKTTVLDNDHHLMEMWGPAPDGKMYKNMEIYYTRRK